MCFGHACNNLYSCNSPVSLQVLPLVLHPLVLLPQVVVGVVGGFPPPRRARGSPSAARRSLRHLPRTHQASGGGRGACGGGVRLGGIQSLALGGNRQRSLRMGNPRRRSRQRNRGMGNHPRRTPRRSRGVGRSVGLSDRRFGGLSDRHFGGLSDRHFGGLSDRLTLTRSHHIRAS